MAFGHWPLVTVLVMFTGGFSPSLKVMANQLFDEEMLYKCLLLATSHPSLFVFVNMSHLSLVTRSISSIYRFIVMLVADITDVR